MRTISAAKPHFFKPLLPGFENGLKIPIFFSENVLDTTKGYPNEALLKRKGNVWRVQVVNGCFVAAGWVRFAEENELKPYDFVVFKHHGNMVFDVTVFDGITQCGKKIHKIGDPMPSEKPRFEASTSKAVEEEEETVRSHFIAEIKQSAAARHFLSLPCAFARSNGLTDRNCEIIVEDEQERSWYFDLSTSGSHVRIKRGSKLAAFLEENGFKKGDFYKLEVVKVAENRRETPVVIVLSGQPFPDHVYASTIKPYSLGKNQCLYIPLKFAQQNGLCGKQKMVLENKKQRTWEVTLRFIQSHLGIRSGWKTFADENGIKVGDAFKFEIVQNGEVEVPVVRFIVN